MAKQAGGQHDNPENSRGDGGMYGVIPVRSSHPGAVLRELFTHNEGYSTMCGHATVALGRLVVEQGLVPRVEPVTRPLNVEAFMVCSA